MRYLNSQEYNTIVLAIHQYSGFVAHGGKGKSQEQFYKTLLLFDMLCNARLMLGWWLVFNPYQQPFDTLRTITDWWLNMFTGAIPYVVGTDYSSLISQIITGIFIDYLRDLAIILPYKKNEGQLLNEEDFKSLNTELAKVLEKCGTEIRIFRGLPSIWSENPIPNGLREYWFTRRPNVTEFLIQNYYENLGINFLPNRVLKDLLEKSKNDTLTISLLIMNLCVIPARGGSKRFKNKNRKIFLKIVGF